MRAHRRLALVFPGFEPMPVEAHCRRFLREARKTAPVYGMEIGFGEADYADGVIRAGRFDASASGEGWRAETVVVIYGLGSLNEFYARRDPLRRIGSGLIALSDFIVSGAFLRFVGTSWRYGLFFLYPIVLLSAAFLLSALAGWMVPASTAIASIVGLIVLAGLLWVAAARMHFLLIMDDWCCARDIARRKRPELAAAIGALAADVAARIAASDADEIVFAAHSFGAVTAMLALEFALDEAAPARPTGLLTTGSSLLKVALHPAAAYLRSAVKTVTDGRVSWIDVQALTDPMNFYGSEPAAALGLAPAKAPCVMRVRFRHQLQPESYRAIKRDLFRVHRQFVYGVEKRTSYAFHAILCGPAAFAEIAANGGLPENWQRDVAAAR